jgi:hypothetical protein
MSSDDEESSHSSVPLEFAQKLASVLGEDLKEGAEESGPQERRSRRQRDKGQYIDEVTIRTVPRYKTSELSGDEWRYSVQVEMKRKGRTVWEDSYGSTREAIDNLAHVVRKRKFSDALEKTNVDDLCDQEGCSEPWTKTYKLKTEACDGCGKREDPYGFSPTPIVRKYCPRHATRGNCGIEDADDNYIDITPGADPSAPPPPVPEEDKAPAFFGGVIDASTGSFFPNVDSDGED